MGFYSELKEKQHELNRLYTVSVCGKTYRLDTNNANVEYDETDKMLIFTTSENYRVALNVEKIDALTWVI